MKRPQPLAQVTPMPPRSPGRLPWLRSGLALLRDPTAFFQQSRRRLGDTFVVDAFGYRLFCVFSPAGVRSLYALPERSASKGAADLALLSHKVPNELWAGRRNFPHDLFGSQAVESYLDQVEASVALQLDELEDEGSFEIFEFARRLGHRVGLGAWAGVEAASPRYLDRLIPYLDRLDASDSFVRPASAFVTYLDGKRRERAAMQQIELIVGEILEARRQSGAKPGDFLEQIGDSWSDCEEPNRSIGIARDVMVIHMGSQSNLFAALGWTLIHLLQRPELIAAIRGGDHALLERCANESIRIAQRSLTLRRVLRPIDLDDGACSYRIEPGAFVATMLSVTNTSSAPGLDRYDPSHYEGRRLVSVPQLEARELVSTFGHGRHACPAQRFAISSIRIAILRLLERFELTPLFDDPQPLRRQLGAVARAQGPCRVRYGSLKPAIIWSERTARCC